ncbi:hypothetical protein [Corynebacterium sp. MNWGS58]|uniref:hypothetical protein n=1 Tax=Corynebacterium sp. 102791.4 TaxID=3104612 RepID=UPI003511EFDA
MNPARNVDDGYHHNHGRERVFFHHLPPQKLRVDYIDALIHRPIESMVMEVYYDGAMIALTVIVPIALAIFAMGMEKLEASVLASTAESPGANSEA